MTSKKNVFVYLFLISFFKLLASDGDFRLDGQAEPNTYVNGCVNAITGSFIHSFPDIVVDGPEPLSFIRHYCSNNQHNRNFGLGMSHNHATNTTKINIQAPYVSLAIEESGGDRFYFTAEQKSKGDLLFYINPSQLRKGYTNCSGGEISGRTNIKNTILKTTAKDGVWGSGKCTACLGDGTKRLYTKDGVLEYEIRPSGNKIFYNYDKEGRVILIHATDSTNQITLGYIGFTYDKYDQIHVTASNGKKGTYVLEKHHFDKKKYYSMKSSSIIGEQKINYAYSSTHLDEKNKHIVLDEVLSESGDFIKLDYHHNKIKNITVPGVDGKSKKIYEMHYYHSDNYTSAKDLYGGKTIYSYTDKYRLDNKDRYHDNKLYSRQVFFWGGHHKSGKIGRPLEDDEGYLLTKGVANSNKDILSVTTYTYDIHGNILSETVAGNLTGNSHERPIKVKDKKPLLDGHETYTRYFTYSDDGLNLLASMLNDDGTFVKIKYLPNTDRVICKLTYADNEIVSREFFEYNHLSILIKKLVDDGKSENRDDLEGVTQRMITNISPNMLEGSSGFGKPLSVIELFLDIEKMCDRQLKRVDYTYGNFDLVTSEACYDADDHLQYVTSFSYDSAGNCIEEVDPIGRVTRYTYNSLQQCVCKELLGSGFYTAFSYDHRGRLTKTEEFHATGEVFVNQEVYDDLNRKTKDIDTFGNITSYKYDDMGRLIKIIYPKCLVDVGCLDTPTESKAYNFLDQLIAETDPKGNTIHKQYTSRGQITEVQNPDGNVELFRYNLNGTLYKKINKNKTYSLLTYDSRKRLVLEETFSFSGVFLRSKRCEYKGNHLVLEIDYLGAPTEYSYDAAGRLIAKITYGSHQSHREDYVYDSLGRLSLTKKWFGEKDDDYTQEVKEFDLLNRVIEERVEDAIGKIYSRTRYVYDIAGNCIQKIVDQDEKQIAVTGTEYTSYNLPKVFTDPLGFKTYYSYDFKYVNEYGQKVLKKTVTDPQGIQTMTFLDTRGKEVFIEKRNVNNNILSSDKLFYDSRGLKIKHNAGVIVEGQKVREYEVLWVYDSLGRPIHLVEDPCGKNKRSSMTYTSFGSVETQIKPDGVKLTHVYDDLGREISLYSSDGSISYQYVYDANDRLLQSVDQINGYHLYKNYDEFGNIIFEELSTGFHISMKYDGRQRITYLTLQDGSSISYEYDAISMLSAKRISKDGKILYEHHYKTKNMEGRSIHSTMITGDPVAFQWDLLGRPISLQTIYTSQKVPDNGYDPVGNLLEVKFTGPWGSADEYYKYDDLNQLIYEQNVETHSYKNDSLCNRIVKDQSNCSLNSINQLLDDGTKTYQYDLNGNLVSEGAQNDLKYEYDAFNRLIAVSNSQEWMIQYRYDSYGRCILRNEFIWSEGWVENKSDRFIFQGLNEIGSFNSEGKIQELRVLGQREGVVFRLAVAIEIGEKIYAPIYDHRFNVIAMVDFDSKQPIENYRYTAFGNMVVFGINGLKGCNSQLKNPWLFGSKRYDSRTGLYNFGKRFYRPSIGRWISPDPGEFVDGLNLYAYTHNRSMICTDFYGFKTQGIYPAYGGMAQLPPEMLDSLGKTVEVMSHHGMPNAYLQYVGEGVGRLLQNKSFSHIFSGDIKPVSGKVGSRDLGNVRARIFTGILTDEASARQHAQVLSDFLDGGEVYYTCFQSQGMALDSSVAFLRYFGVRTKSLEGEYQNVMNDHLEMQEKYGDSYCMVYIPHSRACLDLDVHGSVFPAEMKEKTHVYTLGGAKPIPNGEYKNVINYVNDNDAVFKIGQVGMMLGSINNPHKAFNEMFNNKPNIVYTGYKSNSWTSPIDDHYLDSPGYRSVLKTISEVIQGQSK